MNDTQRWYQSRAVMSGIAAVIAGVLGLFGYSMTPGDQESLIALVTAIGAVLSGSTAVYYRIKATKQIRK